MAVPRHKSIQVQARDRDGKPLEFIAVDFHARVIQHEWDHLNGKVYLDRMHDFPLYFHHRVRSLLDATPDPAGASRHCLCYDESQSPRMSLPHGKPPSIVLSTVSPPATYWIALWPARTLRSMRQQVLRRGRSNLTGIDGSRGLSARQDRGDTVTYVVNRNINFTNVCVKACGFCAFQRARRRRLLFYLPRKSSGAQRSPRAGCHRGSAFRRVLLPVSTAGTTSTFVAR